MEENPENNEEGVYFIILFEELIRPSQFFKNEEEVRQFLETDEESTIEDLEEMLKACEEDECYEYCSIVKEKIDQMKLIK